MAINKYLQKKIFNEYEEIKYINSLSIERKNKYQNNRLKKMLRYSVDNSNFYRKKFENYDIDLIDVNNLDSLPITTKDELKRDFDNVLTRKLLKADLICKSGGTTGIPFKYVLSRRQYYRERGVLIWGWNQAGFEVGDRVGYLDNAPTKGISIKIKNKLRRIYPKSMYEVNYDNALKFLDYYKKSKIIWLRMVPSSMYDLIKILKSKNIVKFSIPTLRGLFSTGEMLYDFQRIEIENFFGVKVFNQYGAGDGRASAFQTKLSEKNFFADQSSSIFEIVDGHVIATLLDENPVYPFIRYEVGDMAEFIDGKYDNDNLVVKNILGRTFQSIMLKDGTYIQGLYFVHIFDDISQYFNKFRIIQRKMDLLIIEIEGAKIETRKLIENHLYSTIDSKITNNLTIKIKFLDKINNDTKKFLYVKREF